ncbi:uncharacterized protein [Procambarus clarkii]|uniref:uncharacterized protein n=1 Tax=Procambarus clarkii TaxID=6728 RepID=UPI0037445E97
MIVEDQKLHYSVDTTRGGLPREESNSNSVLRECTQCSESHWRDCNVASRGDDNNLTTYYHSQPGLVYPWWVLDLGNTHIIHHINILPRPGYYSFRFHNIEVRVGNIREESGNFSSFSLFSTYVGPYSDTMGNLSCYRRDGVTGRYISVQRVTPEDDMLQISDVRVFVLIQ